MVIKQYYSPTLPGDISGEALIFKRGVGTLFDEIRQSILQWELEISPRRTRKKGKGATGNPGLAEAMNNALGASLSSLGWQNGKRRVRPKIAPKLIGISLCRALWVMVRKPSDWD
jgi:hypothetical protein